VAVEAAVVVPAALLLVLLLIQAGVYWHAVHVAHATADVTLAAARVEGGTEQQAHAVGTGFLDQRGGGGLLTDPQITVDRTDTLATVRVQGSAGTVVPGLDLPVAVELSGPVERFVPSLVAPGG
jgi:Flp pilus assembly protein TadG